MTQDRNPEDLVAAARAVAEKAYAPYSNFRVGAVAVTHDGQMFEGVNVENAAYGTTTCAEANAITTAISSGARRLRTVAVVGLDADDVFPCGNCRQMMNEFEVESVLVPGPGGAVVEYSLEQLLPRGFSPDDLAGAEGSAQEHT